MRRGVAEQTREVLFHLGGEGFDGQAAQFGKAGVGGGNVAGMIDGLAVGRGRHAAPHPAGRYLLGTFGLLRGPLGRRKQQRMGVR